MRRGMTTDGRTRGEIIYFLFMEGTFATARTFRRAGTWTIRTDPNGPEDHV
jgi:hypothetical protein